MDIKNKQLLYKIVCARDKRYDGRFYCGVRTTGIFCRPICPARPKIENITFYRSAAEAENAGFRACLRCRPDQYAITTLWSGTAALVGRALNIISHGEANEHSLEQLAHRLEVSDRHLRRLFDEHIGASPMDVATSQRLHLAKQLLTQSNLPVTEVVFASGYRSIRQFNHAFKKKFQTTPSLVRKSSPLLWDKKSNFINIEVPIIPPFDWDHLFGFLKGHGIEGIESFEHNRYRRIFAIENSTGTIDVGHDPKKNQLSVLLSISNPSHLRYAIERVRDLFDTRLNPHAHLNDLSNLKANDRTWNCYSDELGIRIPGAWESFETAICIILGQLVSVEQAKLKVKKLVEQFGRKISNPVFKECSYLFPNAHVLAKADFSNIGVTKVRGHALRELSILVSENRIDLSRSADIEKTKAQLLSIKGIGPWTAEMIAMRCLGDTNAFPKSDLIIKRALIHHDSQKGDWSPWNAYITLALWKKYAASLSQKRKTTLITTTK